MITNSRADAPVAVFDSGVGGLSVLKTLRRVLPSENFIYYGDSANAPYGEKTTEQVRDAAHNVARTLLGMGAKAIVIACNTATSAAAEFLRGTYPDVPIIGMEPAVKPAALSGEYPTVLVMATPLTLREAKFNSLIDRYRAKAEFIDVPCHGLVEAVERGVTAGDEMEAILRGILDPYTAGRSVDAAVLGCTHYIHARDAISKVLGEGVAIFDGALGTARETAHRLESAGLLRDGSCKGETVIYNSSENEALIRLSEKLLYGEK